LRHRRISSESLSQVIKKSSGLTETERALAEFCERSFLKLWSYPNPFKDDGNELCDLLAVFRNYVFIFFDRQKELPVSDEKGLQVLWDRWKRTAIDRQIKTAHGAERYIRSGRPIFLDAKKTQPFPLPIDVQKATIHKIIVAHGAKEACEQASDENVYGSLAIKYCDDTCRQTVPFLVEIDRRKPVHILDAHNFSIVLYELDTVTDFSQYLDEKLRAIAKYDVFVYCGEEDLLAHYLVNYDEDAKQHVIGTDDEDVNYVMIEEGEWHGFVETDLYKNTKRADKVSYFWDELIQRTCQNALDGTLEGNADLFRGESAIAEMIKEPRFVRRALADKIKRAVVNFPDRTGPFSRQVSLLPSMRSDVGYVFLQLKAPPAYRAKPDYREVRRTMLEIACGAAKNKRENLTKVVRIAIDAPKFAGKKNSEDFILLSCETWNEDQRSHYEEANRELKFFETPDAKEYNEHVTQFVPPASADASAASIRRKIGRNDLCPCGSGEKYKKCHGAEPGIT